MRYTDFLAAHDETFCPFCAPAQRMFMQNDSAFLTYAIAPYHPHHLLVVPTRHVLSMLEMNISEVDALWQLIRDGMKVLRSLGYEDYTVLVREGKVGEVKSVAHLHYHIVPNTHIGDLDHKGEERRIMTDEETKALTMEIRQAMETLVSKEENK